MEPGLRGLDRADLRGRRRAQPAAAGTHPGAGGLDLVLRAARPPVPAGGRGGHRRRCDRRGGPGLPHRPRRAGHLARRRRHRPAHRRHRRHPAHARRPPLAAPDPLVGPPPPLAGAVPVTGLRGHAGPEPAEPAGSGRGRLQRCRPGLGPARLPGWGRLRRDGRPDPASGRLGADPAHLGLFLAHRRRLLRGHGHRLRPRPGRGRPRPTSAAAGAGAIDAAEQRGPVAAPGGDGRRHGGRLAASGGAQRSAGTLRPQRRRSGRPPRCCRCGAVVPGRLRIRGAGPDEQRRSAGPLHRHPRLRRGRCRTGGHGRPGPPLHAGLGSQHPARVGPAGALPAPGCARRCH